MERKPISKSIRFEIFKRDSFTCQYCGRKVPEVILEIDHIVPVAEGGNNDAFNLITSCRDCNRGKGKKMLNDMQVIDKQREQLEELNALREQTEMLIQWKEELINSANKQIQALDSLIHDLSGYYTNEQGERELKKLIRRFGFDEVYTSTQISFDRYYDGSDESWETAFYRIGGVCYNRKRSREQE